MKAIVIGAGVIGVTTAWFLNRHGYDVTVIDRMPGPGLETSFANGGLLTASMAEPWNMPGSWRTLLASLGRSDSPMQLRLKALPSLLSWGPRFLWNSRCVAFEGAVLANLRLALLSLETMRALQSDASIDFGHSALGTLRIFRDGAALDAAMHGSTRLATAGLRRQPLSRSEAIRLEPALAAIGEDLAGAIHYLDDETGDAHRFCVGLADHAARAGVIFRYGAQATGFVVEGKRVTALVTDEGPIEADQIVVAAGSFTAPLLRGLGIRLPVRPAKGYSVTFRDLGQVPSLAIPIVDDALHAVVVPLNGAVRVAGTAEFAGFDLSLPPSRIANLLGLVRLILPSAELDLAPAKPWCGLRALSVDGVPLIGATTYENLFVNNGHGHLGWTMAAGSARLVASLMTGAEPGVDPAVYAPARFSALR